MEPGHPSDLALDPAASLAWPAKGGLHETRDIDWRRAQMSSTVAACADDSTTTEPPATSTEEPATSPSTEGPTTELIGSWHRAQTCAEMLAAFQEAGLAESHVGWLQGNFFGGEPGPASGDPCAGAEGPLEHDHFFTDAGAFGSHDENGEEVDHGDYEAVDGETVRFPSSRQSSATTAISWLPTQLMVMSLSSMFSCLSPVSINAPMRTRAGTLSICLGSLGARRSSSVRASPMGQWTPLPRTDGPVRSDTSEDIIRRPIPMMTLWSACSHLCSRT